jgi:ABC-type antimicrobial peptide transport system permease subunit
MLPAVRRAMTELDSAAGVSVGTLRDAAGTELTMRRVGTQFVGAIGILGLLLTGIGLYGVVSYLVASRTAELGIRIALGATPGRLHRDVLGQAARLVGGGIALGVPAAILIASALKTFLAGLSPLDRLRCVGGGGRRCSSRLPQLSAGARCSRRSLRPPR